MNQVSTFFKNQRFKSFHRKRKFGSNNFYFIDQTVPDSGDNNLLHNPIKLSELRTWITTKTFPEQQIRDEYDVNYDM